MNGEEKMTKPSKFDAKKAKWNLILFSATLLFTISLATGYVLLNIPAIILAFLVYRYGKSILFADYYERKRKSKERFELYKQKKNEV